ncbi:MAG: OmpA family protein, partial [Myxococcota bacterium]
SVTLSGAVERRYVMDWDMGVVRATVVRDGAPVDDAVVRFFGPDRRAPQPVDGRGRTLAQLPPGRWTVLATSTTSGVGEATVSVPETPGLTDVTVTVVPAAAGRTDLVVRVTDVRGQPIDGARVAIADAEPLRAADGLVVARGLPRRALTLAVSAPGFVSATAIDVRLDRDRVERLVQLPFVEVPLEVWTADADGRPLAGARIRIEGPLGDADLLTDGRGRATTALPRGRYSVVAALGDRSTSESLSVGADATEWSLVLTEGSARRTEGSVVIEERVRFDFNEATLRPESRPVLEAVARIIRSDPTILKVEVQGHTDNLGTANVNQLLSDLRAQVVVGELVTLGVAPEKLISRGYGRRRPQADNETREGRALNRRVQFAIVEQADPADAP